MKRCRAFAKVSCCLCLVFAFLGLNSPVFNAAERAAAGNGKPYKPEWASLKNYPTPQWLREGKFGIYTHWGVYSVPAMGPNGTWYAHNTYVNPDSAQRKHHEATYGPLEKFGYKDFIPMFTGEKFNAEEWADLFQKAGARFAGPVAEHHDGFSMWDTKYSQWNAAKMGPKRDGTIPSEAKELLLGIGKWLQQNGEAIYGTTPWFVAGEGPTTLQKKGAFNEDNVLRYSAEDIRFTAKENVLYATALDWPGEKILIKTLAPKEPWIGLYPSEIASITMLGDGQPLKWEMTREGLKVNTPQTKPGDYAYVFKIVRKNPF